MIKSVTVTNHLAESITMELGFPEKSGFLIHNIDGLGPPKANIDFTEITGADGAIYNSARAIKRNIVFRLGFLNVAPNSIEDVRQLSYKYFPLKRRIKITIETDNRTCFAYGYVESNEPDIFSKEESAVISVICSDAYLYNSDQQITVFSSIEPAFEFPFSNESLTQKLLVFGTISIETTKTIVYEGDAPVGMVIYLHFIGGATNIQITEASTLEYIYIDTTKLSSIIGGPIVAGDDIIISTVKGDKYAKFIRGGTWMNILNALGPSPKWFELEKGANIYGYTAQTGISNIQFKVFNNIAYEGI